MNARDEFRSILDLIYGESVTITKEVLWDFVDRIAAEEVKRAVSRARALPAAPASGDLDAAWEAMAAMRSAILSGEPWSPQLEDIYGRGRVALATAPRERTPGEPR